MNSHKRQSTEEKLSDVWVLALFKRFQARYLSKWTSAIEGIEKIAMEEWGKELAGLTGDQVSHGLKSWHGDWPPSAIEFKKACTGKGLNGFGLDYVPECYREKKRERLLESDENKEKHKAAYNSGMSGLKDILK